MNRSVRLWLMISGLVTHSLAAGESVSVEAYRDQICRGLPKNDICQAGKAHYGALPKDAVKDLKVVALCTDYTINCTSIKIGLPPTPGEIPQGHHVVVTNKFAITAKNGVRREWGANEHCTTTFSPRRSVDGDEKSCSYDIDFVVPHRYFWVQGHFYEGGSQEWMSYDTGELFSFGGEPYISPDGSHAFTVGDFGDYESSGDFLPLNIYKIDGGHVSRVANFSINARRYDQQVWLRSNEIVSVVRGGTDLREITFRIFREGNAWRLKCLVEPCENGSTAHYE